MVMRKKAIETAAFQIVFQIMIFFFLYKNIMQEGKTISTLLFILSLISLIITNFSIIRHLSEK